MKNERWIKYRKQDLWKKELGDKHSAEIRSLSNGDYLTEIFDEERILISDFTRSLKKAKLKIERWIAEIKRERQRRCNK